MTAQPSPNGPAVILLLPPHIFSRHRQEILGEHLAAEVAGHEVVVLERDPVRGWRITLDLETAG